MEKSETRRWRIFLAHLTEFSIWFYIIGFMIGFIFDFTFSVNVILTFVLALILSLICSSLAFLCWRATFCEWLWGCKLQLPESENKFSAYFLSRLYLKNVEYADGKISVTKTVCGFLLLAVITVIYCL